MAFVVAFRCNIAAPLCNINQCTVPFIELSMPSNKSAFILLSIYLLHQQCTAEVTVSFSIYPPASQQCLNNAAIASGCPLEALTLYDINYCLCGNGGHFIDNTAICLHNSDSLDTQDVWNTMSAACSESDTPIYYSESAFVSIGKQIYG